MHKVLCGVAMSVSLLTTGIAAACDDVAYNDSFAQMAKPAPNASAAKPASDVRPVAQRSGPKAAPVKQHVATVKIEPKCDGANCP